MYQIFYTSIFDNLEVRNFNSPETAFKFLAKNFHFISDFVIRNNKGEVIAKTTENKNN